MIRGLIFDFDGLIIDTETPSYQAWREIYQEHGCELELAEWIACIGTDFGAFDPLARLEEQIRSSLDRDQVRTAQRLRSYELATAQDILPGVLEMIDEASASGLALAVASSSSRRWVVSHLSRLGILDRFSCLRTMDDVSRVKPDPELFVSALACMGLTPEEAIVFEDSLNGVIASRQAGLFCVAIPNPLMVNSQYDQANLVIKSMADLRLQDVIEFAESRRKEDAN